jgi:hypothetical protein
MQTTDAAPPYKPRLAMNWDLMLAIATAQSIDLGAQELDRKDLSAACEPYSVDSMY